MATIGDIKKLIDQLIKENAEGNKELINFYQKKVNEESLKALPNAMNKHL
jgi:hypothetical protein